MSIATNTAQVNVPSQPVHPMRLILRNGYPYPYLSNIPAANRAPGVMLDLPGVVHFEWHQIVTVEFADDDAFQHALRTTGWKTWGYRVLEAQTSAVEAGQRPAIIAANCAFFGFNLIAE
ncbi:MAG: hypothetical protein KGL63_12950 [Betaproteobacteria bacterium]|nr:hypothetical protein [Betaproteobacteria bacterium]